MNKNQIKQNERKENYFLIKEKKITTAKKKKDCQFKIKKKKKRTEYAKWKRVKCLGDFKRISHYRMT